MIHLSGFKNSQLMRRNDFAIFYATEGQVGTPPSAAINRRATPQGSSTENLFRPRGVKHYEVLPY